MLINPYNETDDMKVAKASRRTDMYAFSLVLWELMSEERPFVEITKETVLAIKVHQGVRPSIDKVPSECPDSVLRLMKCCWNGDRLMRETAVTSYSILQREYSLRTNNLYDVYISYDFKEKEMAEHMYHRLTQLGCRALFLNKSANDFEEESLSSSAITLSKAIIACVSQTYQENPNCIVELRSAKVQTASRPIIPIFFKSDHASWQSQELAYLCQLGSADTVVFDFTADLQDIKKMLLRSSSSHVIKLVQLEETSKLMTIREGSEYGSDESKISEAPQISHEVNAQIELMYRHLQHILRVQQDRGTFNLKLETASEARRNMTKLSPRLSASTAIKKSTSRSDSLSREPQPASSRRDSRSSNRSSPRHSEEFGVTNRTLKRSTSQNSLSKHSDN